MTPVTDCPFSAGAHSSHRWKGITAHAGAAYARKHQRGVNKAAWPSSKARCFLIAAAGRVPCRIVSGRLDHGCSALRGKRARSNAGRLSRGLCQGDRSRRQGREARCLFDHRRRLRQRVNQGFPDALSRRHRRLLRPELDRALQPFHRRGGGGLRDRRRHCGPRRWTCR